MMQITKALKNEKYRNNDSVLNKLHNADKLVKDIIY